MQGTGSLSKHRAVLMVTQNSGPYGAVQSVVNSTIRWLMRNTNWMVYAANISPVALNDDNLYIQRVKNCHSTVIQYETRSKFSLRLVQRMANDIRQHNVLVAHAHGYKSDVHLLIASRLRKVPFVSTLHNWTEHDWKDRFYSRIDQLVLRYADVCIAVSEGMKKVAVGKGLPRERIVVVHNWIDAEDLQTVMLTQTVSRVQLGLKKNDVALLVPARLSPEKGHKYLIRALRELIPKYPCLKALFAGSGVNHDELVETVREARLEAHVQLLGFRSDIYAIMAVADWIVLPSLKEALPLSVLEAMALRKPIIASSVGGVPEVVQHGVNGLLVPPGDWQALAAAIEVAVTNRDIAAKYGESGYEIVTSQFSPDSQIPKIVKVYEDVLKTRGIA
jgi:glycosyltransferase involved in cell wall biosynthesis